MAQAGTVSVEIPALEAPEEEIRQALLRAATEKLVAESKSLKRALIMEIQSKRRNMHERYELIIANISDAAN